MNINPVFCMSLSLCDPLALAIQVTSTGPQTLKQAQGESVTLSCTYTLDAVDVGDLDIEWTRVSQDMTQKDELVREC